MINVGTDSISARKSKKFKERSERQKMDNKNNKFSESQKKAYKFNIIDFFLIVLIVGAVSVLAYIMLGTNLLTGSEDTTIIYTIEMGLVRNEFLPSIDKIIPGTKLTDSVRRNNIGEVVEVKITDAYPNTTDLETGVVHKKPYPDHSKVSITVKAKCKKENDIKYVVNGKIMMVGVLVHFRTPYFVNYGNCVYLDEIAEDSSKKGTDGPETAEEVLDIN